jgi:hypothetical protein
MATEVYLHAFTPEFTPEDLKAFCFNHIGSEYFCADDQPDFLQGYIRSRGLASETEFILLGYKTPKVWLGDASFIKADLCQDDKRYVPAAVDKVNNLIPEGGILLTAELAQRIVAAFDGDNESIYPIGDRDEVQQWCEEHLNQSVFVMSW